MTQDELTQWQRDNGVVWATIVADGRLLGVTQMLYTARLWIGDTVGWSQAWDYPTLPQALAAAGAFGGQGDPRDGWVRHTRAGQPDRYRPDGSPTREDVAGEGEACS